MTPFKQESVICRGKDVQVARALPVQHEGLHVVPENPWRSQKSSQARWGIPVVLTTGRLGQEDLKLHNSLGYIRRKEKNKGEEGIKIEPQRWPAGQGPSTHIRQPELSPRDPHGTRREPTVQIQVVL